MLRGGNVTVILYCLGFHIFRLFHAINCIWCILPNFIVSIWYCEVKFSWTAATVPFIALHNSLMLMQCSAVKHCHFIKCFCWGYKSFVMGNVHLYTVLSSWSYRLQYLRVSVTYCCFFSACCVQCTFNCLNRSEFLGFKIWLSNL